MRQRGTPGTHQACTNTRTSKREPRKPRPNTRTKVQPGGNQQSQEHADATAVGTAPRRRDRQSHAPAL
eukprot:14924498-Alexandrium_andersonii.AAC.1